MTDPLARRPNSRAPTKNVVYWPCLEFMTTEAWGYHGPRSKVVMS